MYPYIPFHHINTAWRVALLEISRTINLACNSISALFQQQNIYFFFVLRAYTYVEIMHTHTYVHTHRNIHAQTYIYIFSSSRRGAKCVAMPLLCIYVTVYVRLFFVTNHKFSRKRYLFLFLRFFNSIIHLSCNKTFGRSYTRVSELTRIDRNEIKRHFEKN